MTLPTSTADDAGKVAPRRGMGPALLALLGLLMRVRLPGSPRWLASHGRLAGADKVVKEGLS